MIAIIVFGILIGALLVLLLARYGTNPIVVAAERAERSAGRGAAGRARIEPHHFRALAAELLVAMGLEIVDEGAVGDARRLLALRREPFVDARTLVFLEPDPPGGWVEPATVVELAESVKGERAQVGLLMTPYRIDSASLPGLEAPIELIDGARFRQLIAAQIPVRLGELDRYRGFGTDIEPRMGTRLTPRPAS